MRSIEEYLLNDEKIIWQRSFINPANQKNFKAVVVLSAISLTLVIPIVLILLNTTLIPLIITGIMLTILSIAFGIVAFGIYLTNQKLMKKINLSFNHIKFYQDIYILTNKRWIQKSLDVLNFNVDLFPIKIKTVEDVVFIDFEQIQSFFSKRRDSFSCYFIGFDIDFPVGPGLLIPYEIFPEFIKKLSEIIPIKREVHEKHGKIIYHHE